MSADTKSLQNVFKNASEVTSIETDDRLLLVKADGSIHNVVRSVVSSSQMRFSCNSPQWIRIASYQDGACLLSINTTYSGNAGVGLLMYLKYHYNSQDFDRITLLANMNHLNDKANGNAIITKLRFICRKYNRGYIDIYYSSNKENEVVCDFSMDHKLTAFNAPEMNAEIPDGATVKEFVLNTEKGVSELIGTATVGGG